MKEEQEKNQRLMKLVNNMKKNGVDFEDYWSPSNNI